MIFIEGTKKIKGALDLGGINKQLKTGDRLPVTVEEFNDHHVQIALSMGFLKKVESKNSMPETPMITLKNIYDRPVRINILNEDVRPGESFTLSQKDANSADIRGALAKGLLDIVSSVRPGEATESTVKVGNIFKEKEPTPGMIETPHFLETNEEATQPKIVNVIETETPDPIENSDINDPKGKTVVWNPNCDPIAHTRTEMDAIGVNKDDQNTGETNVDIGELKFVDQEMEKERLTKHPILRNQPVKKPHGGIDFL